MSRPTALGLHIYSGAFTFGAAKHFDVLGQWEEGPWGAATFELNFPGVPHPLSLGDWPVKEHVGKVDLVYANPPCAPWSSMRKLAASTGPKEMDDPRLQFVKNVVNTTIILAPRFFVLESVCQMWSNGREFCTYIGEAFLKRGYGVTILLTNAILYGASQHRRRFHLIAHRYALPLEQPVLPDVGALTVKAVIGDLEGAARWLDEEAVVPNHRVRRPDPVKEVPVMERLVPGQAWNDVAKPLRDAGGDVQIRLASFHRQDGEKPSRTVAGVDQIVHYSGRRFLTVREGARLCGYPDTFVFAPARNRLHDARQTDVTQAVLPPMGEYLAGLCRRSLEAGDPADSSVMEVVDFRPLARKLG